MKLILSLSLAALAAAASPRSHATLDEHLGRLQQHVASAVKATPTGGGRKIAHVATLMAEKDKGHGRQVQLSSHKANIVRKLNAAHASQSTETTTTPTATYTAEKTELESRLKEQKLACELCEYAEKSLDAAYEAAISAHALAQDVDAEVINVSSKQNDYDEFKNMFDKQPLLDALDMFEATVAAFSMDSAGDLPMPDFSSLVSTLNAAKNAALAKKALLEQAKTKSADTGLCSGVCIDADQTKTVAAALLADLSVTAAKDNKEADCAALEDAAAWDESVYRASDGSNPNPTAADARAVGTLVFDEPAEVTLNGSQCLYKEAGKAADLPMGEEPYVIEVMARPDTEAYGNAAGGLVSWGTNTHLGHNILRIGGWYHGIIHGHWDSGIVGITDDSDHLDDGNYHNITATWNGVYTAIYVDGVLLNAMKDVNGPKNLYSKESFCVGFGQEHHHMLYFKGKMKGIKIFKVPKVEQVPPAVPPVSPAVDEFPSGL